MARASATRIKTRTYSGLPMVFHLNKEREKKRLRNRLYALSWYR